MYSTTATHSEYEAIVVTLTESLLDANAVRSAIDAFYSSLTRNIVVDFSAVEHLVSGSLFPDASPIEPLMELNKLAQGRGGRLILCSLQKPIEDVWRVCQLDRILAIASDVPNALGSLGPSN